MFRHKTTLLFAIAIGAGGLAIWYSTRPRPIPVQVRPAALGTVEQTVVNTRAGTVKACRRARLSLATGGIIASLKVHEGDRVERGQRLLELWNRDLQAQLRLNRAEVEAVAATAVAACLKAEVAQREADRLRPLRKSGAVSEEKLDQLATTASSLRADCESANTRVRIAQLTSDVTLAQIEKTRLRAPFDGIVAEVNGELFEYTTPSPPGIPTPPAVDLIDDACFYVTAPIDEVDAARIAVDQRARVTLDAFDEREFDGRVRRIAPYVLDREKQARTVDVEVEFTKPGEISELLAGYSADVEIILERAENTLRVPAAAVVDGDRLYLLNESEGVVEERRIESGLSNWDHMQVLSGIEAGDLIITSVDREGVEDGAPAMREEQETK